MKTKIKILKPSVGLHEGSCFRELLDIWHEKEFCNVVLNADQGDFSIEETLRPQSRPWMNSMGDILLYDNPVLDKLEHIPSWNKALFANEILYKDKCSNWIFWTRFPKKYFKFQKENKLKNFEDRKNESIFIGNNTTSKRLGDWYQNISFFYMGSHLQNKKNNMQFSYEEYLSKIFDSKFGLCLPGVGPKCLRDIEYIGLGTVPIFTPGVSSDYYNKLEQDKHYLFAKNNFEINKVILECSQEKWSYMSNECIKWFEKNCSIEGSFKTTLEILENV